MIFLCGHAQFRNQQYAIQQPNFYGKGDPNKTIYLATAISGTVLLGAGLVMFLSDYGEGLPGGGGADEKKIKTGETLMYVGGGLVLISIPFYIASKRNRGFGININLQRQNASKLHGSFVTYFYQPSLSVKITIPKS